MKWRSTGACSVNRYPRTVSPPSPDLQDSFYHIVDVALGIDSSGDRQPDQFHRSRDLLAGLRVPSPEHDRPDLDRTNSRFPIQLDD